ncbi:MAG: histidine kinase [Chitinophagaceae bacterium]|jgi:sensor histidine kinase YesM
MLHYGIEDGLPSNMIYDIYQDPDGFIWIGTDKGVARYNGQKFETFTTADGLSDNECFFFQPDHYGRMWIGTFNGELCYYKDGVFHNAKNTPWLKLPFKSSITSFININRDSSITILFREHQSFIEINQERIKHFAPKSMSLRSNDNHCVNIQKKDKDYYDIFFSNRILTIDQSSKIIKIKYFDTLQLSHLIYGNRLKLISSVKNAYYTTNLEPVFIDEISINKSIVVNRFEIDGKEYFTSTNKGLYIKGMDPVLPEMVIHDALKDRKGDYWIGTASQGIYKLSSNFSKMQKLLGIFKKPIVYAQTTPQYLFFADKARNTFRIKKDSSRVEPFFSFTNPDGMESRLDCIHWIKDGVYYNFSNNHNFRINNINSDDYQIKKIRIYNLGGLNGVFFTDSFIYLRDRMFFNILPQKDLEKNDSIVYKQVCLKTRMEAIFGSDIDQKKQLWSSSLDGVYKIIGYNRIRQTQFGKTSFRQFAFFKKYLVGISHHNELLICSNYETRKIHVDTLRSGDCVWDKFYKLNDTALLISTNNYYRILTIDDKNKNTKYTIRIVEKEQIPYQSEFLYIDNTDCYFFKHGNLNRFPVDYLLEKDILPEIKILSLKTKSHTYQAKGKFSFNYYEGASVNIIFTSISFDHINLTYEYAISTKNSSDIWTPIIGQELNLFKIGSGTFIVKVRAKTMSGEYSEPAIFELSISKPFWFTYWFIGIVSLFAIFIITVIARWSIKRNLRKKENEVRFLRSEYKALNALMNPHFIFNSLNSVQSLVNNNENSTASKYIRIFSDLIRQNMRNISQDLIPLSKELSLVENYLRIEQLRFKSKLSFEINIDENVETELILIPPLLIQPLVENAIKHGIWPLKSSDGNLKISIYEKEEILFIEIIDNGVGLKKKTSDTMHESYAMGNIYKRIEQLSQIHQIDIKVDIQEIHDETGNVSGVKAEIIIRANNHA